MLGELVCNAEQFATGVCVCEGPDAQAVGWVQLPLEELTTGLLDLSQLEQTGGGEQGLDIPFLHSHLGGWISGHQGCVRSGAVISLHAVTEKGPEKSLPIRFT